MSRKLYTWRQSFGLLLAKYLPIPLQKVLPDSLWLLLLKGLPTFGASPETRVTRALDELPNANSSEISQYPLDQNTLLHLDGPIRPIEESLARSLQFDIVEELETQCLRHRQPG